MDGWSTIWRCVYYLVTVTSLGSIVDSISIRIQLLLQPGYKNPTKDEPPPFYIPRLRFVEAGLALSYNQAQLAGGPGQKSKSLSPRAAFLVEELISGAFIKYIHNMDCNPLLDPDEPGYEIAEFLACTQHIQYAKTGGLAFISDYQGIHHMVINVLVH